MTTKLVQQCCPLDAQFAALSCAPPGKWLEVSSACSFDRYVA
jgi:hypothetical protein